MGGRLRSPGLLLAAFLLEGGAAAMAAEPSAPPPSASYAIPQAANAPPPRPRPLRRKDVILFMPFVGIHSYQQAEAFNTDPGLRLGGFIGGRLNDIVSLNGEVRFDITNPGDLPAGTDVSEFAYSATFSPLFQLPTGGAEFVLGPKVGAVSVSQKFSDATTSFQTSGFGFVLGGNAGVFVPVSPATSLGVLLSFELAKVGVVCGGGSCNSTSDVPISKVLGLTASALF